MTPAVLVHKIWHTRIGVSVLLLSMMIIIGLLIYIILVNTQAGAAEVVRYGSSRYVPDKAAYCSGDTMTYTVTLSVNASALPTTHIVDEDWKGTNGITIRATQSTQRIPLVEPTYYSGPARRVIPEFLKPGIYWFDHVSQNGTKKGYRVGPVNVVECEQ